MRENKGTTRTGRLSPGAPLHPAQPASALCLGHRVLHRAVPPLPRPRSRRQHLLRRSRPGHAATAAHRLHTHHPRGHLWRTACRSRPPGTRGDRRGGAQLPGPWNIPSPRRSHQHPAEHQAVRHKHHRPCRPPWDGSATTGLRDGHRAVHGRLVPRRLGRLRAQASVARRVIVQARGQYVRVPDPDNPLPRGTSTVFPSEHGREARSQKPNRHPTPERKGHHR